MRLTWFGANSWLIQLGQQHLLVDPWLVGSLVFGNLPWFFQGQRRQRTNSMPDKIDLILLSQGLEDHTHRPTLEQLDRAIPVVGSVSAAKVAKQLGYAHVTSLVPGQTGRFNNQIEIQAVSGAPIGLQVENGYLIKLLDQGTTLYYEPHGFPHQELKVHAPVDVVISPIINLELPLVGAIIQGHTSAMQLAEWLQPQVFLPTAAGEADNVQYQGFLASILQSSGSIREFRSQLASHHLRTQVIDPQPGEPVNLSLNRV